LAGGGRFPPAVEGAAAATAAATAALLEPMSSEDWEAARRLGESVSSWSHSVQQQTGGMFTSIYSWGFGLVNPITTPPKTRKRGKGGRAAGQKAAGKKAAGKKAAGKKAAVKKASGRKGKKKGGGSRSASQKQRRASGSVEATRLRPPQVGLRSAQIIAYAMAREHQISLMTRFAATVASSDPALRSEGSLASLTPLAYAQSGLAQLGARPPPGMLNGASDALAGNGWAEADAASAFESSLDVPQAEASDVRSLVPYEMQRPYRVWGRYQADYASFLLSELRRLIDEGVPLSVADSSGGGSREMRKGARKEKGGQGVAGVSSKKAKKSTVKSATRSKPSQKKSGGGSLWDVAKLGSASKAFGEELQGATSKLWSLWGSAKAADAHDPTPKASAKPPSRGSSRRRKTSLSSRRASLAKPVREPRVEAEAPVQAPAAGLSGDSFLGAVNEGSTPSKGVANAARAARPPPVDGQTAGAPKKKPQQKRQGRRAGTSPQSSAKVRKKHRRAAGGDGPVLRATRVEGGSAEIGEVSVSGDSVAIRSEPQIEPVAEPSRVDINDSD